MSLSSLCPALLHSLTVRFPPSSTTSSKLPPATSSSSSSIPGSYHDGREGMSAAGSEFLKEKLLKTKTGRYLDSDLSRTGVGPQASSIFSSPASEIWNSFYLDFKFQPPISSVCTPEVMGVYHKIFYLQWKLHRVAYALSNAWLKGRSFYKFEQDYFQQKRRKATQLRLQKQREEMKKREQQNKPHTPRASSSFQRASTPTTPSSSSSCAGGGGGGWGGGSRPGSARRSASTRLLRSSALSATQTSSSAAPTSTTPPRMHSSTSRTERGGDGEEEEGRAGVGGYSTILERMKKRERYQKRVFVQQKILSLINEVCHVVSNLQIYLVEDLLNPTWRLMLQLTLEM